MPKPPEKSEKTGAMFWRLFVTLPRAFLGGCFSFFCWNFSWTMHLIHGFTISKLTRGLDNSVFTGIKQYSLLSFKLKKNNFSTLFTQLHVFSREPLRGPPTNHFPYMKGYNRITLSILQLSPSAKSRIPLAPFATSKRFWRKAGRAKAAASVSDRVAFFY